jgi:SAM-dependent methyltransferase
MAMANSYEKKYVEDTYDKIASTFSATRYKPWPPIVNFLSELPDKSNVLEVGCGNGKNFCDNRHYYFGVDISKEMLKHVPKIHPTIKASCLDLPIKSNSYDAVMSIAVIHHLKTEARRLLALKEMIRVLKKNHTLLISVWAYDPNDNKRNEIDKLVPFTNRYTKDTYLRYYHLFTENDFTNLISKLDNIQIIKIWYAKQNYFLLARKNN